MAFALNSREMSSVSRGLKVAGIGIGANLALAVIKVTAGILGNSYALIADGIESTTDVFSSFVVWSGLRISAMPPDANHPYGHGKAEPLAGVVVAIMLLLAAITLSIQSIREILRPHHAPAWFTLVVLSAVVVVKEVLYRTAFRAGDALQSSALKGDAGHHRSDAITSCLAFIGIAIALVGGAGYESADDWAALAACVVIAWNGLRLLRPALDEVMDATVSMEVQEAVRKIASEVEGVIRIEKCRIRKSGLDLFVDIHVEVDGETTVRHGHEIAHLVTDALKRSKHRITEVLVHIEPALTQLKS